MRKPLLEFPPRLIESDSEVSRLLRQAQGEPRHFPNEARGWHRLVAKRERSRRVTGYVLAFAGVCLVLGIGLMRRNYGLERVRARAESLLIERVPDPSQPGFVTTPKEVTKVSVVKPARLAPAKVESKTAPAPATVDEKAEGEPGMTAKDTNDCLRLARDGKHEEAVGCYGELAAGSGVSSELALYEKARLEARVLARGDQALATLDEHERRFPRGALSTEVGLTRIELLMRQGRANEALAAISVALGGPIGTERGGDLQVMRGDILSSHGDCVGARVAYAAARQAGIHPSRLKAGEQRCAPILEEQP